MAKSGIREVGRLTQEFNWLHLQITILVAQDKMIHPFGILLELNKGTKLVFKLWHLGKMDLQE